MYRHGELRPEKERNRFTKCIVESCNGVPKAKGLCEKHYCQIARHGKLIGDKKINSCWFPGCGKRVNAEGLCGKHYALHLKTKLISIAGGKCSRCGFDEDTNALCFHHEDPAKKEFLLNIIPSRDMNILLGEVSKTKLLCINCHSELHEKLLEKNRKVGFVCAAIGCKNLAVVGELCSKHYQRKRFGIEGVEKKSSTSVCKKENCASTAFAHDYCRYHWRSFRKQEAVNYMGGSCSICGYSSSIAALHFHHIDRSNKVERIGMLLCHSWEKLKSELDKTNLLCGNCHFELHGKDRYDVESLVEIFKPISCGSYIQ